MKSFLVRFEPRKGPDRILNQEAVIAVFEENFLWPTVKKHVQTLDGYPDGYEPVLVSVAELDGINLDIAKQEMKHYKFGGVYKFVLTFNYDVESQDITM